MMKSFNRLMTKGMVALLLLGLLSVPALAAGTVTVNLSMSSGYAGGSVTISGTADPGQWVSIKAVDAGGNIIYFSAACCDAAGDYTNIWIVPDVLPGSFNITAGYGGTVASAVFTVVPYYPPPPPNTKPDSGSDDDNSTVVISDNSGNFATGTVETNGEIKAEISRESFEDFSQASDEPAVVDMNSCVIRFSAAAIDHIANTADPGDISLTVRAVDGTALSEEAGLVIGSRPVFDFALTVGATRITELGGAVVVSMPYTIRYGEDEDAIVAYYIDASGTLQPIRGRYHALTQTVEFPVNHFSVYGIGYHKVTFNDVVGSDWYYHAVTFCAAREITTGTGNNLFSPDATLTRGQFVVMLMRAYGLEADAYSTDNFDDAGDTYYTGYLSAAKRLGLTNGIGNNLYAPETQISRQDMFTLVYRALNVLGEWPEADGAGSLSIFSDAELIADYAEEAADMLVKAGVISGSGGELDPLGSSTRAQMAQVLYNLLLL